MIKKMTTNEGIQYKKLSPEEMKSRGILGRLVGPCADFINPTRNGRKYSEQLWENVFNNPIMQEKINNGVCFGELGHPEERTDIDIEKVAICMREQPYKNEKGQLCTVFDILDTPNGRILKTLCDYGSTVGISSRGQGDIVTDFEGNETVDPDTYECTCFDVVLIPAVKTARMQYVKEDLDENKISLRKALTESFNKATKEGKRIMKETLDNLNIKLNEDVEEDEISEEEYIKNGEAFITKIENELSPEECVNLYFNEYKFNEHPADDEIEQRIAAALIKKGNIEIAEAVEEEHEEEVLNITPEETEVAEKEEEVVTDNAAVEAPEEKVSIEDNTAVEPEALVNGEEVIVDTPSEVTDNVELTLETPVEEEPVDERTDEEIFFDYLKANFDEKQIKKACKALEIEIPEDADEEEDKPADEEAEEEVEEKEEIESEEDEGKEEETVEETEEEKIEENESLNESANNEIKYFVTWSDRKDGPVFIKGNEKNITNAFENVQEITPVEDGKESLIWINFKKHLAGEEKVNKPASSNHKNNVEDHDIKYYWCSPSSFYKEEEILEEKIEEECNNESCTDKKDSESLDESKTAIDDGDAEVVKSLQEALKKVVNLDETVKDLQEKLAVSDAKVNELTEENNNHKKAIARLAEMSKVSKELNNSVSSLKESLNEKDTIIEDQKSRIARLVKSRKQNVSESLILNESVTAKNNELKTLNEALTNSKQEVSKLTEELSKVKANSDNKINELTQDLAKSTSLKEAYLKLANTAVNKYIDIKARMIGLTSKDIKRRLGESYNIQDVDQVCEDLKAYQLNVNKLPFSIDRKVGIKVNEHVQPKSINRFEDDDVDESLIKLAKIKL